MKSDELNEYKKKLFAKKLWDLLIKDLLEGRQKKPPCGLLNEMQKNGRKK